MRRFDNLSTFTRLFSSSGSLKSLEPWGLVRLVLMPAWGAVGGKASAVMGSSTVTSKVFFFLIFSKILSLMKNNIVLKMFFISNKICRITHRSTCRFVCKIPVFYRILSQNLKTANSSTCLEYQIGTVTCR